MPMIDPLLAELAMEAETTRRVLERVPDDKMSWKPHPKSMSLGGLAMHVATTTGGVSQMALKDGFDIAEFKPVPEARNNAELMAAFDKSIADARTALSSLDDAKLMAPWNFSNNGKVMMTFPRIGLIRQIALNHLYHHRGQLSVYLRLLDIPVPSIYGPTADENPFA